MGSEKQATIPNTWIWCVRDIVCKCSYHAKILIWWYHHKGIFIINSVRCYIANYMQLKAQVQDTERVLWYFGHIGPAPLFTTWKSNIIIGSLCRLSAGKKKSFAISYFIQIVNKGGEGETTPSWLSHKAQEGPRNHKPHHSKKMQESKLTTKHSMPSKWP